MAERIGIDLPPVVTAPDHLAGPVDDHGPDGDVAIPTLTDGAEAARVLR